MSGAPATELSDIEATMRQDPAAYWQSPELQERYRALLAGEEAPAAAVADDDGMVPVLTPREALAEGIEDYGAYSTLTRAVGDVLAALPTESRRAVRASFDALPESAQCAALAALWPRGNAARASGDEVDAFAATGIGAPLVREWGSDAGWRLGQAEERLAGVYARLTEPDATRFEHWFNSLDDAAMTAVLRRLAG